MDSKGQRGCKILLVDEDRELAGLLSFLVRQAGLVPVTAHDTPNALELFDREQPTMAMIDLDLRPRDGFELLAALRRRSGTMTIIVLTAVDNEDDKVRAFEMGADDFVVKPCGHRELIARVQAHARRADRDRALVIVPDVLEVGPLRLDPAERTLSVSGEVLRLSGTEFRLLHLLMRNGDSVVPTATLANHVCGYDDAPAREVVRVTVHRLRRKMGDNRPQRRFIHTIPGVGLRLRPVSDQQEISPPLM